MQHGATLKNCHITIIENARYLPFGSVFNLHVFIYDPVDSSLSQRPLYCSYTRLYTGAQL